MHDNNSIDVKGEKEDIKTAPNPNEIILRC